MKVKQAMMGAAITCSTEKNYSDPKSVNIWLSLFHTAIKTLSLYDAVLKIHYLKFILVLELLKHIYIKPDLTDLVFTSSRLVVVNFTNILRAFSAIFFAKEYKPRVNFTNIPRASFLFESYTSSLFRTGN